MNLNKKFKLILNIIIFLLCSNLGLIISTFYAAFIWIPLKSPEIGIEIVSSITSIFIILGFFGAFLGGILGLIILKLYKLINKKK